MKRLVGAIGVAAASFAALHELGRRWGATPDELSRPMPGDDVVPHAKGQTTHAITIHASPEEIWPWIVQMGYH
jgi:hypothetical protein